MVVIISQEALQAVIHAARDLLTGQLIELDRATGPVQRYLFVEPDRRGGLNQGSSGHERR